MSTYRHIPWRPGVTLERLNSFAKDTMVETLDIVFTEVGSGLNFYEDHIVTADIFYTVQIADFYIDRVARSHFKGVTI